MNNPWIDKTVVIVGVGGIICCDGLAELTTKTSDCAAPTLESKQTPLQCTTGFDSKDKFALVKIERDPENFGNDMVTFRIFPTLQPSTLTQNSDNGVTRTDPAPPAPTNDDRYFLTQCLYGDSPRAQVMEALLSLIPNHLPLLLPELVPILSSSPWIPQPKRRITKAVVSITVP